MTNITKTNVLQVVAIILVITLLGFFGPAAFVAYPTLSWIVFIGAIVVAIDWFFIGIIPSVINYFRGTKENDNV